MTQNFNRKIWGCRSFPMLSKLGAPALLKILNHTNQQMPRIGSKLFVKQHRMKGEARAWETYNKKERKEWKRRKEKERAALKTAEGHSSTLFYPSPVSLLSHEETRVKNIQQMQLCKVLKYLLYTLICKWIIPTYCMLSLTFEPFTLLVFTVNSMSHSFDISPYLGHKMQQK